MHGLAVISRDLPKEERLFCTRQKHPPTKRAAGRPDPFNSSISENNMQMCESSTEKRQQETGNKPLKFFFSIPDEGSAKREGFF